MRRIELDLEEGQEYLSPSVEVVTGKVTSAVVIGTARVAAQKLPNGEIVPKRDNDQAEIELLRHAITRRLNFIDTARAYGDSEVIVGEAIKGFERGRLIIATKVGLKPTSPRDLLFELEESTKRLDTVPDIVFMHDRWNGQMGEAMDKCIQELGHAVKRGLINGIGISNFRPDELRWAIRMAGHQIEAYQAKVNFANPRPDVLELLEICKQHKIHFMASSSLDRGSVVTMSDTPTFNEISERRGLSIAQLAILTIRLSGMMPIVQSHDKAHIEENIRALECYITSQELSKLQEFLFRSSH